METPLTPLLQGLDVWRASCPGLQEERRALTTLLRALSEYREYQLRQERPPLLSYDRLCAYARAGLVGGQLQHAMPRELQEDVPPTAPTE